MGRDGEEEASKCGQEELSQVGTIGRDLVWTALFFDGKHGKEKKGQREKRFSLR
jgi:hypothetical protein